MNKNTIKTDHLHRVYFKEYFFAVPCMLLLLFQISCSSTSLIKSKSYNLNFNNPEWERIEPDTSDYAFINNRTNSIIMVNSLCKKYESTSLKHLTSNILAGIDDIQIENRTKKKYFGRSALETHISGRFDGVRVYLSITTLSKNRCTYDFILISRTKKYRTADEEILKRILEKTIIK